MLTEILIFLFTFFLFNLWRKTWLPNNFPPGPVNLPLVGCAPFLGTKFIFKLSTLAKRYGSVIGLAIGTKRLVVINDSELAKDIFKKDITNGRPDTMFFGFRCNGRHGVISAEGREWKEQRQFLVQQLKSLGVGKKKQQQLAHTEILELITRIKRVQRQPVEIDSVFGLSMVNTMLQIGYGKRYEQNNEEVYNLLQKTKMQFSSGLVLIILNFVQWLVYLSTKYSGYDDYVNMVVSLNKFNEKHIQHHLETYDPNQMRDFIDYFLHNKNKTTDIQSSFFGANGDVSLRSILQDIFMAGSDTFITSISWAILFLSLNPNVQNKCQEEIDREVGRDSLPEMSNKPSLPYCAATCAEILRKATIAPMMNFHSILEDTEIKGYKIPKDTYIFANIWHIHHDEKIWGDPHNFRPERFLTEEGTFKPNNNLMPFGAGKRLCPGKEMALHSLFLFLTALLQSFSFALPQDEKPDPLNFSHAIVATPPPFKVIFISRELSK